MQYNLQESFIYQIMNVVKFCFGFSRSESDVCMAGGVYIVQDNTTESNQFLFAWRFS